jgi:hypothetical protein
MARYVNRFDFAFDLSNRALAPLERCGLSYSSR